MDIRITVEWTETCPDKIDNPVSQTIKRYLAQWRTPGKKPIALDSGLDILDVQEDMSDDELHNVLVVVVVRGIFSPQAVTYSTAYWREDISLLKSVGLFLEECL